MHNKEGISHNQKQQTCDGDTHHIRALPQGSASQRQKNKHTRGHNKIVLKPNTLRQR